MRRTAMVILCLLSFLLQPSLGDGMEWKLAEAASAAEPQADTVVKLPSVSEIDDFMAQLVSVRVKGKNVRLRNGPGTEYDILGTTSQNDEFNSEFIALKDGERGSDGKLWYKLLYVLQRQEETSYSDASDSFTDGQTPYIRSDFTTVQKLSKSDIAGVENTKFRVIYIDWNGSPQFTLAEDLQVTYERHRHKSKADIAAGTTIVLFGVVSNYSDIGRWVNLWEPLDEKRIRFLGEVEYDRFEKLSFGPNESAVRSWLKKNNPQ